MDAFSDSPHTEKYNEHGEGNNLHYGVASMQGWRMEMEDAHSAKTGLENNLSDWSYFAVFDGHAGAIVSAHSADNLLESIMKTDEFKNNDIINGIHTGFLNLDNEMRDLVDFHCDRSGSTAVCTFISPDKLFIGNCGDSRAVLCSSGRPIFSTRDHKPILPAEKERIQAAGGSVMVQRVNGSLAVSRALGDYEYKNVYGRGQCEQLVSPEPEIFIRDRDFNNDEFLILACDGIWDVMTNEDLCDFIYSRLLITDDLEVIANQVIDTCLYKVLYLFIFFISLYLIETFYLPFLFFIFQGSRDNMSIILVKFPAAPKPNVEAQNEDAELDMDIERRIKGSMKFSLLLSYCCCINTRTKIRKKH